MLLFSGIEALQAFTEIRLAYIQGLYFSTVLLALAFIEHELAGALYAGGLDRAATARLEELLADSLAAGTITDQEFQTFDHLRKIRNSYTHYRPPMDIRTRERRALTADMPTHVILKGDAESALFAIGSFLARK